MHDEHLAICDEEVLVNSEPLVAGPISDMSTLSVTEKLFRIYLLYDDLKFIRSPQLYAHVMDSDWWEYKQGRDEKIEQVSDAYAIDEVDAEALSRGRKESFGDIDIESILGPKMRYTISEWERDLDLDYENPSENIERLEAHIADLIGVVRQGGGILVEGSLERELFSPMLEFPEDLFANLDNQWKDYLHKLDYGDVGIVVPPVTAIVLNRCARRDAIPRVLRELREEWARPRKRLWVAIEQFKNARTLREADEAKKELEQASQLMMPGSEIPGMPAFRNFWGLVTAVAGGAATGLISGGNPLIGGAVGGIKSFGDTVTGVLANRNVVFRTGAFDLSREISVELGELPRMREILSGLLSNAERDALGLC